MTNERLLANYLKDSKNTIVITGYKINEDSNIPDIFEKEGWWNDADPKIAALVDSLDNNYDKFHEFYSTRVKDLQECNHNNVHKILSKWQGDSLVHSIATQAVDDFHEYAGCNIVYHLNGRINNIYCKNCKTKHTSEDFLNKNKCRECSSHLRPDIVLYGDPYREFEWFRTIGDIQGADLVVVIGTNLLLSPKNQVKKLTKGKLVVIDDVKTEDIDCDLFIEGNIGEILANVDKLTEKAI